MNPTHINTLVGGIFMMTISVAGGLLPSNAVGQICKWVDENGISHFAETCPEGVNAEQVEISEPPKTAANISSRSSWYAGRDPDVDARSLSWNKLGPRPENVNSRYLQTTGAIVSPDDESLGGQFVIRLNATKRLQAGSLVEARFPDPANPGEATFESFLYEGHSPVIRLASRPANGFKCWNYRVVLSIFSDETKTTLLDKHEQLVQSRFDLTDVQTEEAFTKAISGPGNCPRSHRRKAGSKPKSLKQLQAECEQARERLLKPERENLIKRCKSQEDKDPGWCEAYYRDHGAARRQGNSMSTPKYSWIPECVAVTKALEKDH